MTTSAKLDAALAWAARGFRVFPLVPLGVTPVWKDFPNRATRDPAEIGRVWGVAEYNIGVATDGFILVDVDVKNGKQGVQTFQELDLPVDTLTVRTPSGGFHFYYAGPTVAPSQSKVGPGIDIRSHHSYAIAPGSETLKGIYTLEHDAGLAAAPEAFVLAAGAPREKSAGAPVVDLDQSDAIIRAIDWLRAAPPATAGDGGDILTFQTAAKVKDFGVSEDVTLRLLLEYWNPRCSPNPWPVEMLKRKVENAFAYGSSSGGISAPSVDFAGVDIPVIPDAVVREHLQRDWFAHGQAWADDVAWLYHEIIPALGVAVLTAPSQAGKTFLGLYSAYCLATGTDFFGTPADDPGGTLILVAEAEGSIGRRLAALRSETALPIAACTVGALGAKGALEALLIDLKAKAAEILAVFGVPVRQIILDTLPAAGLVDDQNDNVKAVTAMQCLQRISKEMNAVVLALMHPPKAGSGIGGAGGFHNSADVVLEVMREGRARLRELEITKIRDAEQRALGTFTLEPVEVGTDRKGRAIISCYVKPGAPVPHGQPQGLVQFMAFLDTVHESECVSEAQFKSAFGTFLGNNPQANRLYKPSFDYALGQGMLSVDEGMVTRHVIAVPTVEPEQSDGSLEQPISVILPTQEEKI